MEARITLFENQTITKFVQRLVAAARPVQDSGLPLATQHLVMLRASQLNGCGGCVDMHSKDALHAGETQTRLNLVAAWREATVFTEAERAALALAEEGTRLADTHVGVRDETWAQVRKHYDDDQIGALIATVATINAFNRLNVIARTPAGGYEAGAYN